MRRRICIAATIGIVAFGWAGYLPAHESPVDPVSRSLTFWMEGDRLRLRYEVQISERSALLELYAMDRDRNGVIQTSEQDAFLTDKARQLAERMKLQGEMTSLKLTPVGPVVLRRGWRQIYEFEAELSALPSSTHRLTLSDTNSRFRPGPFQWKIRHASDLPAQGAPPRRGRTLRSGSSEDAMSLRGYEDWVELEFAP